MSAHVKAHDLASICAARTRFVGGWNYRVTGRRRATATDEWFAGWNAADASGASKLLPYPDLSDIRIEVTGE
ncbi:hypothetical protein [Gluconobacter kondonii]|uniref:hypothetical protein n=1 Tax=Gluconobacter kondonii TaxID=941463 RepID=UPI001B8D15CE|nr:hypothetical protein [Gluconobacter kondonii]MBS1079129.1 hypothetical protein [Gluconobacter kondonii]